MPDERKLKVGDDVKVIRGHGGRTETWASNGEIVVCVQVNTNSAEFVLPTDEGSKISMTLHDHHWEFIAKFKTGDKVRIKASISNADILAFYTSSGRGMQYVNFKKDKSTLTLEGTYEHLGVKTWAVTESEHICPEKWLTPVKAKISRRKYPENAITQKQALDLLVQIYPKVTHVACDAEGDWQGYEGVKKILNHCYDSVNSEREIVVPIKYSGDWKESIYPRIYFSSPIEFEGFDNKITVHEDGSLEVGCNKIPTDIVDKIIVHRHAELKKFATVKRKPSAKKKVGPARKKAEAAKKKPAAPKKKKAPAKKKS